jgi:hypothetical protein
MNLIFGILVLLILVIGALSLLLLTSKWMLKKAYKKYLYNGTKFFCKDNPDITCQINKIYPDDLTACRLELIVTYPSGNICNILTTSGDFLNVWEEDINDN